MKDKPVNTHLALLDAREAIDVALRAWVQGEGYCDMHKRVKLLRRALKRLQRHTKINAEADAITKEIAA